MIPMPIATPAGSAKRATERRNPSGRHGPALGASASTNAGMPIVTVDAIVNWRGSSGKIAVGSAIASTRTAAKTVLVTNSCATRWMLRRICRPSATIAGHHAEVAADEHEVGDRSRHLRARALGDREARLP